MRPGILGAVNPTTRAAGLVLAGIVSVQAGGALVTTLFDDLGPGGAVLLRSMFAALVLAAIWPPRLSALSRRQLREAALFGLCLAAMNACFYVALDRLPLGIAVTLEFAGPLAVAVGGSRRPLDLLCAGLAAAGIVLLTGGVGEGGVDGVGAAFALAAGAFWAAYILVAARVGRVFADGTGLAVAMAVSAVLLVPFGVADGGRELFVPALLATGLAVALLSSVIPYSLEMEALRRLPAGTFGVLMSLEPAVAATIGFIALDQGLSGREVTAIAMVVVASAGALHSAATPPRD